jgi:hypothetical protein
MVVWNADMLMQCTSDQRPSVDETREIVDELYAEWVPGVYTDISSIHLWACQRFDTTMEEINRETLLRNVSKRVDQLKRLYSLVRGYSELREDGVVQEKVGRIAKVIREARNSLQSCAILFYQMDDARQMTLPDAWDPESYFQHVANDEKATTFQRLLFVVLEKLAADGLRRMNDECWEAIVVKETKEFTHAWRRLMTIREYIYDKVQKESDYEEWKCLTNPHDNGERVVDHLLKSNQVEFPQIVMNRYLWAYNNGLYNVRDDMFWPFAMCRLATLDAVSPEAVAHIASPQVVSDSELPDENVARVCNGVLVWHVLEDGRLMPESFFKVKDTYYLNFYGRDDWDELGMRMQTFRRGLNFSTLGSVTAAAVRCFPVLEDAHRPSSEQAVCVDGVFVWNATPSGEIGLDAVFECDGALRGNRNGQEIWRNADGKPYTIEKPSFNDVAVRHFDIDFRYAITPEAEAHFDPTTIELPAMEKIMNVQELTVDTQQWLVLMLCRLFFPVGYDRWQVVLFIRGIAGSGKSTIAQIIRHFYPPTCVTTLSSNIEQKFGLSGIYKGLICICSEVREDFGLDQADWQSAVSGEEVQIASKGKTAFSHKWETPFLWLGNEMPKYRNASGSVDRRVLMVEFGKRVVHSDPHLIDKFKEDVDMFQRKGVSLFHSALRKHGNLDIWEKGVLGEQLKKWREAVKLESDPMFAFLMSEFIELDPYYYISFKDFKELFTEYRRINAHDKGSLSRSAYEKNFLDTGLSTKKMELEYPPNSGVKLNAEFVIGCRRRQEGVM